MWASMKAPLLEQSKECYLTVIGANDGRATGLFVGVMLGMLVGVEDGGLEKHS